MRWKKSPSGIHNILRVFVNTLTADDKHYLLNRDNLVQRIQMRVSQKQITFSECFFAFLKSLLNFKHLPKKGDPQSGCVSGNTGFEKYGEKNVQKALFQRTIRQTTQEMARKSLAI